ncbi:MAG: hypothetical protein ACKVIY_07900 [Acidimicrobiales bacterium]|jgi:hypothetical protein
MSDSDRVERLAHRAKREKVASDAKGLLEKQLNDLAVKLAEELAQVQAREGASNHDVRWQIGTDLNAANFDNADEAIFSAIGALGLACGAKGVGVWEVHRDSLALNFLHSWRPLLSSEPRLPAPSSGLIRPDYLLQFASLSAEGAVINAPIREVLTDVDSLFGDQPNDDFRVHSGAFTEGGETFKVAAVTSTGSGYEADRNVSYLLRGVMILLAQFSRRVEAEDELRASSERHIRDHSSMMRSATALIAASPENFDDLLLKALIETAELLDVPAIVDWDIDYQNEMYTRTRMWMHESVRRRAVPTEEAFGTHELLEAARLTKTLTTLRPDQPSLVLAGF